MRCLGYRGLEKRVWGMWDCFEYTRLDKQSDVLAGHGRVSRYIYYIVKLRGDLS